MQSTAKLFPRSKGWITAKLTLNRGYTLSDEEARGYVSFGKPHRVQFGLVDVSRNPAKVIYRDINKAAVDPEANPAEIEFDIMAPVPFIAKCGAVIVEVKEVITDFLPLQMIKATILAGKHFNDRGDYEAGDTLNIGPLTDHWRILRFPDLAAD